MLKESREDWRADALALSEKHRAACLEAAKWKALAEGRANEIEYLHGLSEKLAERLAAASN